jgi:hypothetical protein
MLIRSIRFRLVLAIVVILGLSGLAGAGLVRVLYDRTARAAAEEALRGAAAAYADLERNDVERMAAILEAVTGNSELREAFAARDRDRLQALALPIHKALKAEHRIGHWNFVDAETKRMFLRVHLPAKHDDLVERPALLKAMARRERSAGKELGKSAFALRVGKPVYASDGSLIGYVELGEEIDHFLGRMKEQTGNDFAMFIAKRLIDESEWARTRGTARNGWSDWPDVVVVNSTTTDQVLDQAAIAAAGATGTILEEVEQAGSSYARGVFPVRDSSGAVVGGLLVRHDISALRRDMRAGLLTALVFMLLLAVVATTLVSLLVDRLIFRRLRAMMASMEDASMRLAGGDFSVGSSIPVAREDEIGKFEKFFAEFLGFVGKTLHSVIQRSRPPPRPAGPAPRP